jgi:hypothetical protein
VTPALQEIRILHRWEAIQQETDDKEEAKRTGKRCQPIVFENENTPKQLLARSRYLLLKSADKWTKDQKIRAKILFKQYPDIKKAYSQRIL